MRTEFPKHASKQQSQRVATSENRIQAASKTPLSSLTEQTINLHDTAISTDPIQTQDFTISINDLNEAPTILDQTFSIDENSEKGTVVGSFSASDADDGDSISYKITHGENKSAFKIDSDTGVISVNRTNSMDYEETPSFALTIEVSDSEKLTATAIVTINLNDVNEAPEVVDEEPLDLGIDSESVDNDTPTITVSDNTGSRYAVEISSDLVNWVRVDEITVGDDGTVTFEDLTSAGVPFRFYRVIELTPTVVVDTTLDEDSENGTIVATVDGGDPDSGDSVT